MRSMPSVKKNHHFVWANYLARWSSNGRDVFYSTSSGKAALDSVKGLARERHFYKVRDLTHRQVALLYAFARKSDDSLYRIHAGLLEHVLEVQTLERRYRATGHASKAAEQAFEALRSNVIEDLHTGHELRAREVLDALSEGKLDALSNENAMMAFTSFLGHQITRTKGFKEASLAAMSGTDIGEEVSNFENIWWMLSYMFGTNIARSLYFGRRVATHTLLINNSSIPFTTSDQPVINIKEDFSIHDEGADFYFPISPTAAYVLSDNHVFPPGLHSIDAQTSANLNAKHAVHAHVHIFGTTLAQVSELLRSLR